MRNFDLTPFRRSTVGFDRLFDWLENGPGAAAIENHPPFDVVQVSDDRYRITLAVAGFRRDEIDITAKQNLLTVTGRKAPEGEGRYLHRGIGALDFERSFVLGDYVQVSNADLADGLLTIELVREVPEQMRPRKIEIGGGQSALPDQRPRADTKEQKNEELVAA